MNHEIRPLFGMSYSSIELEHPVGTDLSDLLVIFANYLRENGGSGIPVSISTTIHPTDDDLFLTTLVWSEV